MASVADSHLRWSNEAPVILSLRGFFADWLVYGFKSRLECKKISTKTLNVLDFTVIYTEPCYLDGAIKLKRFPDYLHVQNVCMLRYGQLGRRSYIVTIIENWLYHTFWNEQMSSKGWLYFCLHANPIKFCGHYNTPEGTLVRTSCLKRYRLGFI